jgi:hypothetical protein
MECARNVQKACQEASNHSSNQSNDDIADATITATAYDCTGEKACDESDNEPGEQVVNGEIDSSGGQK